MNQGWSHAICAKLEFCSFCDRQMEIDQNHKTARCVNIKCYNYMGLVIIE